MKNTTRGKSTTWYQLHHVGCSRASLWMKTRKNAQKIVVNILLNLLKERKNKMPGYTWKEAQGMNLKFSRWVYGNRLGMWHPVGSEDRDYNTGFSSEWIKNHSEAQAISAWFSLTINGALGRAIKSNLIKDVEFA